jgi:hypothetical protein
VQFPAEDSAYLPVLQGVVVEANLHKRNVVTINRYGACTMLRVDTSWILNELI